MDIEFEFMARDMPQQNHLTKLGVAVLVNRERVLMARANIPVFFWYKFFKEAFKMTTLLDALMIVEINGEKKLQEEHWSGQKPKYVLNLCMWGEAGTVKVRTQMTRKLKDHVVQYMMVGYAKDHAGDVYHMWDLLTNGIHETCNIIWLCCIK